MTASKNDMTSLPIDSTYILLYTPDLTGAGTAHSV